MKTKVCSRCLYTAVHPLHLTFDEAGVCSGCRVHEEKDELNWTERWRRLESIVNEYKNESGNNYDCIVPVSGARDSHFIVETVKRKLGLNPLLVTYNKHYNTDIGIRNLANLRIKFDCDIVNLTVKPETVKKITRATIRKMGSIYWHCIAGQTVFPVQMAVKLKIPLIIWGAQQGVDQVGMYSHLDEVEMTRKYRKEHDLMGFEAEDLIDDFDMITESDILQYKYPHDKEIERVGVRGIYLNNYIRWDSKAQHEKMIAEYNYESIEQNRTFDTYNDVDCFHYSSLHDYVKYLKHGYSKVTDHACRELRLKRLSREQALNLVASYENKEPINFDMFLKWIGIEKNSFYYLMDQHRNPSVWRRNSNWEWELISDFLGPDEKNIEQEKLEVVDECKFEVTSSKRPEYTDDKCILIGKGFPEYHAE